MKLDVKSIDRIGITQEILYVFVAHKWDLGSVEMHLHHTFITVRDPEVTLETVKPLLMQIDGVEDVHEIDFLPTEFKQKQVKTLLSSIPTPIFRLSPNGYIEDMNDAAEHIWQQQQTPSSSMDFLEAAGKGLSPSDLAHNTHKEIFIAGSPYLAQIEPIECKTAHNSGSGAILFLHNINQIGMHISAVSGDTSNLIGESPEMLNIKKQIHRVAASDFPILINGETGTGKELVARNCHDLSPRNSHPFLAVNCAALPENLLESELFGYAPGAFSGANKAGKPGLFELAEGGTVFLDEIGEMSPYLQAKLLRFLQDYTFRRVGGVRDIKANVRIISATHRDLTSMVKDKNFREDLFYRLNVLKIKLPALRERKSDIPLLVQAFLAKAAQQAERPNVQIAPSTLKKMIAQSWPGNIRQLENRIFRAVVMSDGNILTEDHLLQKEDEPAPQKDGFQQDEITNLKEAVQNFEAHIIKSLMPSYPSTRKLAERLGVSHNAIATKMRQYKIEKHN